MRRRRTITRKPAKTPHGSTTKPKRNNAPTAARRPISPIANLQEQLKRQDRELEEAREERAAIAEVLRVISSSSGELKPVFEAMLANAVRLCEAKFGSLVLIEGDTYRRVALHNAPAALFDAQTQTPVMPLTISPVLRRLAATNQLAHIADLAAESPNEPIAKLGGARSLLAVPLERAAR